MLQFAPILDCGDDVLVSDGTGLHVGPVEEHCCCLWQVEPQLLLPGGEIKRRERGNEIKEERGRRSFAGWVSVQPERAVSVSERKTERTSVRTNDRTAAAWIFRRSESSQLALCVCVCVRPCLFINHLMFIHSGLCKQVSSRTYSHTHRHTCTDGQSLVCVCVRSCFVGILLWQFDSPLTLGNLCIWN